MEAPKYECLLSNDAYCSCLIVILFSCYISKITHQSYCLNKEFFIPREDENPVAAMGPEMGIIEVNQQTFS